MQTYDSVHTRTATRARKMPEARRRTVVLLDDDDALRCVCAEVLRAAGFDVVECATLLDAFSAVKSRVPDVLVLDRELPDGSGLDLARWARRRASFDGVRIVAHSGRKDARDAQTALDAGCDAFVGKPCAPARLIAEIAPPSARRGRCRVHP